jgi:predicted TIM-barrel fold metal-dependent hydrolase
VPHPEEWLTEMKGKLAPADLRRVMRDNARGLVGLAA